MHKHKSFITCFFFSMFPLVKVKQPEAFLYFYCFFRLFALRNVEKFVCFPAHPPLLPFLSSAHLVVYMWLLTPVAEEFFNVLCSVKYFSWSFFPQLISLPHSILVPFTRAWKADKGFQNQIYRATCLTSLWFCLTSFTSNKLKSPACCMVKRRVKSLNTSWLNPCF